MTLLEFAVTIHHLVRETYDTFDPPDRLSPASGSVAVDDLALVATSADCPDGAYWLLEPLRHNALKRYSGTMSHTVAGRSKDALTVAAFVHFAYLYSNENLVFADVQGQWDHTFATAWHADLPFLAQIAEGKNGERQRILFDIMTHTPSGYVVYFLEIIFVIFHSL